MLSLLVLFIFLLFILLLLFGQSFNNLHLCRGKDVDENVVLRFIELQNISGNRWLVVASDGSILHELKQARFRDFIFIKDVEYLEDKLHQLVLLFL